MRAHVAVKTPMQAGQPKEIVIILSQEEIEMLDRVLTTVIDTADSRSGEAIFAAQLEHLLQEVL